MIIKELINRLQLFDGDDEVLICNVRTGETFEPEEKCAYDDKGFPNTQEKGKCFLHFESPISYKL